MTDFAEPTPVTSRPDASEDDARADAGDDAAFVEFLAQCVRLADWAGGDGYHFRDDHGLCDPQDFVSDYYEKNEFKGSIADHVRARLGAQRSAAPVEVTSEIVEAREALLNVQKVISDGAAHGFSEPDWAERLFVSQQKTSRAIDALRAALARHEARAGWSGSGASSAEDMRERAATLVAGWVPEHELNTSIARTIGGNMARAIRSLPLTPPDPTEDPTRAGEGR